jgi:DNA-directed RNA polymerase I, II, and III subunit RPABC2
MNNENNYEDTADDIDVEVDEIEVDDDVDHEDAKVILVSEFENYQKTFNNLHKLNSEEKIAFMKRYPYLTSFEYARVIGERAEQIQRGSEPFVEVGSLTKTVDIAKKELDEGKFPFVIRRTLPDGTYYDFKVSELYKTIY